MPLTPTSPATDVFRYILTEYAVDRAAARTLRRQWAGVLDEIRADMPRPGPLLLYTVLRHDADFEFDDPVRGLLDHLHELFPASAIVSAELEITAPFDETTPLGPRAISTFVRKDIQGLLNQTKMRLKSHFAEVVTFKTTDDLEPFFEKCNGLLKKFECVEFDDADSAPMTAASLSKAADYLKLYADLRKRVRALNTLNLLYTRLVQKIDRRLGLE